MINFESQHFRKLHFKEEQIEQFLKLGIALIAKKGYKIRSTTGHHVKIIEKLSELLKDEDILVLGNKMRQERNFNLYDGRFFVGEKDSREYLDFVKSVFKKADIE